MVGPLRAPTAGCRPWSGSSGRGRPSSNPTRRRSRGSSCVEADAVDHPPRRLDQLLAPRSWSTTFGTRSLLRSPRNRLTLIVGRGSLHTDIRNTSRGGNHMDPAYGWSGLGVDGWRHSVPRRCGSCWPRAEATTTMTLPVAAPTPPAARRRSLGRRRHDERVPRRPGERWRRRRGPRAGHRPRHGRQLARSVSRLLRHVPDLHHRGVRDADRCRPADHNTLVPRLATTWEGNDDQTQFTFTLDPTATFADGSPVEAADVKCSWERLADLQGPASYLVAGMESIEAPDAGPSSSSSRRPTRRSSPRQRAATSASSTRRRPRRTARRPTPPPTPPSSGSCPTRPAAARSSSSRTRRANRSCSPATTTTGARTSRFPEVTFKQVKDASAQLPAAAAGRRRHRHADLVRPVGQLEGVERVRSRRSTRSTTCTSPSAPAPSAART